MMYLSNYFQKIKAERHLPKSVIASTDMATRLAIVSVVISFACPYSFAQQCDNFEDGDYSTNPPWLIRDDVGDVQVIDDPFDSQNLILAIHGTTTENHAIEIFSQDPFASWDDVVLTVMWRVTSARFDLMLSIRERTPERFYSIDVRIVRGEGQTAMRIAESPLHYPSHFIESIGPMNTWWELTSWPDLQEERIIFHIRNALNLSFVGEYSIPLTADIESFNGINDVLIFARTEEWQYLDNYCLESRADCNGNGRPDRLEDDFDEDGQINDCDQDIDNDGISNDLDACDFTPLGVAVDEEGRSLGDIDKDCDTDLDDYRLFQSGFSGAVHSE